MKTVREWLEWFDEVRRELGVSKLKLLYCKCGDCTHWEIGKSEGGSFIQCVTCGDIHRIDVHIDIEHEKLEYRTQL